MCAVVESGMFHTTTLIELTGETDGISRITATCSGDRLGSVYLLSEVPGHWEHSLTGDPYTMVWRGRSLAR